MEQEDCSDYVEETHNNGCAPEGEYKPPPLLNLHFLVTTEQKLQSTKHRREVKEGRKW